jgi:hypothetical protein
MPSSVPRSSGGGGSLLAEGENEEKLTYTAPVLFRSTAPPPPTYPKLRGGFGRRRGPTHQTSNQDGPHGPEATCGPTSAAMGAACVRDGRQPDRRRYEYKDAGSGDRMTDGIRNGDPGRCGSLMTQKSPSPSARLGSRVHTSFSPLLSSLIPLTTLPLSLVGAGEGHDAGVVEGQRQEQE